jgi:glc operon protein GlcG
MNRQYASLAVAIVLSLTAARTIALETRPILTLAMAKTMADACEARAAAEGWRKVNIAVFDAGANLKLFRRQDDAYVHSIQIAQMKGHTSAGMPRSTRALGDLNYKTPGRPVGIENVEGFAMFPGGLPIVTADGVQIGGIGVSGATGAQDELCSQAGIDAIAGELK